MNILYEIERMKTIDDVFDYLKGAKGMPKKVAKQYLYQIVPLEKVYQKKIIDRLKKEYPSGFIWKAAAGPYSAGGIPDICAVIGGRFYGFEVKRPHIGKVSALQVRAIEKIRKAGGFAGVVCLPEDAIKIIERSMEDGK